MRHRVGGRKLNRTYSHLQAMLRNLATSLFDKGRIVTTDGRAKECRPFAEKLITLARKGGLANYRRALALLKDETVTRRLFHEIAPLYRERSGGYTRILRLSTLRLGDRAQKVIFELVVPTPEGKAEPAKKSSE